MVRKITWDWISIEITRKCQLKCKHCYRGEAQNITISDETLDTFFKNTEVIGKLHITGGEPTLAVDKLNLIADKIHEYGIPLFSLQVVTNGYDKSAEFVEVIKRFNKIIDISHRYGHCNGEAVPQLNRYILICVSCDRYHNEQGYNPKETVQWYKSELKGIAKVTEFTDENLPNKSGNAKQLEEAVDIKNSATKIPIQIEYLTKDHKPFCPHGRNYSIVHPEQIYVVCEMYLDVYGRLLTYPQSQEDFITTDNYKPVLDIHKSNDFLNDIIRYNNGKMRCLDRMKLINKEQLNPEYIQRYMQEVIKSDTALKLKGYRGANSYDNLVDSLANKYVSPCEEKGLKHHLKTGIEGILVTDKEIDEYKQEILNDDEVYKYDKAISTI